MSEETNMSNPRCPICRMSAGEHKMDCQNAYYVQALTAERDALREAARWIPVSEKLPNHGKLVLTYGEWGGQLIDYCTTASKFTSEGPEEGCEPVTHWMSLPEPPQ